MIIQNLSKLLGKSIFNIKILLIKNKINLNDIQYNDLYELISKITIRKIYIKGNTRYSARTIKYKSLSEKSIINKTDSLYLYLYKLVYKIRGRKCNSCESKQNLGIHHIDFNHGNMKFKNLEILCWNCHRERHKTKSTIKFRVLSV